MTGETGNITSGSTNNPTHTYETPGTYTVTISGDIQRLTFDDGGDKEKLLSIENWGGIQWTSMSRAFRGCSNLVVNASDAPDLTNVTLADMMFFGCSQFNQPIDHWDVSNLTNMSFMFTAASSFNQPLNSWDVSNVTTMSSMFSGALAFNQPLDNWDVSMVNFMPFMFSQADAFNQPINNWNVGNVSTMQSMFQGNNAFNQPLDNWDVSSVTNMTRMFSGTTEFNQPLGSWDVSSATSMQDMLNNTNLSIQNYDHLLTGWSTLSLQSNLFFGAFGLDYCTGEDGRNILINTFNWSISDGVLDCPPTISNLSPADDDTSVGASDNLVISFNEAVQGTGTGLIRIKNGVGTTKENFNLPDPNVTFSGNTITINPTSDLAYSSDYYMEISSGGIEDLTGNDFAGISDNTTWNFTTEDQPDLNPPTIISLSPADESTGVFSGWEFCDNL